MYLFFDIGGTHIRAALSNGKEIVAKEISDTPQNYEEGLRRLSQLGKEKLAGNKTKVICGIAGVFQTDKLSLFSSPNLPDWVGKPLKDDLEKLFSTKVDLENDAALAGLGESVFGAGRNYSIVMYYTVGTGVGGVRIVNKTIDKSVSGMEPGQQIIDVDGTLRANAHTLEDLTAGKSIEEITHQEPSKLRDDTLWKNVTEYLATGIYNSVLHWSPEVIVMGGGLINENVISIKNVTSYLSVLNCTFPKIPPILKSKLRDESGLWGALAFLNSSV